MMALLAVLRGAHLVEPPRPPETPPDGHEAREVVHELRSEAQATLAEARQTRRALRRAAPVVEEIAYIMRVVDRG